MNTWLAVTIAAAFAALVAIIRALVLRAARKRRPRLVEQPNSYYTPKLVLDRDAHALWRSIPLDRVHEINRGEVRRLLDRVEALGVDALSQRERDFLNRIAELNPPSPQRSARTSEEDPFWSDPFGFERSLRAREPNG